MRRMRSSYKMIYAIAVVLIFWYILYLILNSFVIPNPGAVLIRFTEILLPVLTKHLVASSYRLFIALFFTTLVGYVIGLMIGISKRADQLISPIIYLFFPVPRIAFLPVFMILFGLGDVSKIVLMIAIAIFQVMISSRDGVKDIPLEVLLSAHSLKLSKWQMICHIYIPASLPKLFTSLRLALGSSMAALFFAENYATKYGIGYYIMNAWVKVDYEGMYCGIIAISLLGVLFFKGVDQLQRKVCAWQLS